jgi:uncharacterized membrane-anchored protein
MNWGAIFGSGGLVAGAVMSMIAWLRFRPKDKAEVTEQLNAVALRQLNSLEARLTKAEASLDSEKAKSQRLEAQLDEHRKWDIIVLDRLHALGIDDIPAPPAV